MGVENKNVVDIIRDSKKKITVIEFEKKVRELEGVQIILRYPPHGLVDDYTYVNSANGKFTIAQWVTQRITPCIPEGVDITVLDGHSRQLSRWRMSLARLRNTYSKMDEKTA